MDCLPHIHVAAYHASPGYRVATPGIGVLCAVSDFSLGAGVFSNSVGGFSRYASVAYQPVTIGSVKVGAFAGVVNGYPHNNGGTFAFGGGLISIPVSFGSLHFQVLPPVSGLTPLTVGLSATVNF